MKLFRFVFLLIFISQNTFSQTEFTIPNWHFLDQTMIPDPSSDMPNYIRLLYSEEVNLIELETEFKNHYDAIGWHEYKEDLEGNRYAKFFHHWYEAASAFVDENGIVKSMSTKNLKKHRKNLKALSNNSQNQLRSPTSAWSFLGPRRTIWRKEHNAAQPVAPWQVNIYSIDVAVSNPSILYAASETGAVYKTTDKGVNWVPFDNYNFGRPALSIAIHPTNPNIVVLATSTDIIRTADGGATWSIVETQSGLNGYALAFSPTTPSTIYAATAQGLLESTDTGVTWTQKIADVFYDVAFRPGDGTTIYALGKNSGTDKYTFYKSSNSGSTFSLSMTGFGTIGEGSGGLISVTSADADYVYAMMLTNEPPASNPSGDAIPKLLKSTDNGTNWSFVVEGNSTAFPMQNWQGFYDFGFVVSQLNADHLIAGTSSAYKSTDGGLNWSIVGGYGGDFAIHPDIQAITSIVDNGVEETWLTTDGGINYSTDFYTTTANWEARIDGLDGTDFWGFAQGWNEDYIVGGRYHNGNTAIHENYPNQQSLRMGGAESPTGWAMHGRERYAAFDDISETIIPDQIDEEAEGSFLFTKHPNIYYYGDAFSRVMIDHEDYMKIYTGSDNSFWKSEDGGGSWEATHTFTGKPYHFDISRADGNYFYLTTDAGFFKSTDRGESFTSVTVPSVFSNWHLQNMRVAASSTDKDELWILNQRSNGSNNTHRIYKSTDGGSTWVNWSTATLNGRKWGAIAHQAGTNGGIYIASDRGSAGQLPAKVMYRDNTMSDWVDFSNNLPQSANPIKLLPFYRDGKLRWGGNRGAWEVDFYEENWTPIVQPFVSGKNQICERDTVNFDSYSVAKGSATYAWSIPGATWTSSNLNQREVQAIFPGAGTYPATLTITQAGTSYFKSVDVTVSAECSAEDSPGNALALTGASTDYAATVNPLNLTTNTITLSAWIKRNGDQNDWAGIIFNRASEASGLNFGTNNELRFHWQNNQWGWNSGLVVPDGKWAHVAMVVTPTETTLYLNGVSAVNTANPSPSTFDGVLNFGADPNWSARRFNGEMDEVMIYNKALTQNEIRELMHFTRDPANEPDLISYWQFNRNSGAITDRAGGNHAALIGAASRVTSTAPIGTGESSRLQVTAAGTYTFGNTDVIMEFPAGGSVFPNGEICVSRIDRAPDHSPEGILSPSYWVIHNYGTNSTFDELTSIQFNEIGMVGNELQLDPSLIDLYKRESGDWGDTWGNSVDVADAATSGTNGSATFSSGNNQTSFSQFIISKKILGSLPVELISFDAWINNEKNVELKWTVGSEINFSHYEVQRSRDGINFTTLEQVNSNGNIAVNKTYGSLDKNPLRGLSYYRLKIIDLDGTFEFSDQKSIVYNALADKVILYPIPLSKGQKLNIKTELSGPIEIRIYAADGEDVADFIIQGDTELELPNLASGVYGYTLATKTWRKSGVLIIQ